MQLMHSKKTITFHKLLPPTMRNVEVYFQIENSNSNMYIKEKYES